MEINKYAEFESEIWDIPGELFEYCDHLPNQLTQIDEHYDGTAITRTYICECGEIVEEVYELVAAKTKRGM
jgi:hypothetical protein